MLERIKLRNNGKDFIFKLNLKSDDCFYDQQQEINKFIENSSNNLVNEAIDGEIMRFRYKPNEPNKTINFGFTLDGIIYKDDFRSTGFSIEELKGFTDNVTKSFFFLELYNSFDINTQEKLSIKYLTKIVDISKTKEPEFAYSKYIINDKSNQFHYLHIPINFLSQQISNEITLYIRYYFYNAKDGKIKIFSNDNNKDLSTAEKLYFPIKIDIQKKTWIFDTNDNNLIAKQIFGGAYVNKLNNTYNNQKNSKIGYPTNYSFDPTNGKYF